MLRKQCISWPPIKYHQTASSQTTKLIQPEKLGLIMTAFSPVASTTVTVEEHVFPPYLLPRAATKPFFLAGAGVRGLMIEGEFVTFSAIGVYMEEEAVMELSGKWKSKTADELEQSVEFFRDIVTGPFEKFTRVTLLKPLTGVQFSEKVMENCTAILKSYEKYNEVEEKATQKFLQVFKDQQLTPGRSVIFRQSYTLGTLTIAFVQHDCIPGEEDEVAVIENKNMSEAVLESIIGKQGVSPAAKKNMARRLSQWMN